MEFGILGPLQVSEDGRPVRVPPGKQSTLLVALLVHRNQVVSAQRLTEWLWAGEPPGDAASALQTHLSRLRAALAVLSGGEQVVVTRGSGYELRVDPDAVDALRFERLVTVARGLVPADAAAAAATLRQALLLWRGRALDGFADQPFARPESLRLEEARLAAIEDLMESELAQARHAAITGELQSLVTDHPTRERLTSQLMRALYRAGRQAEALQVYGRLRRRLVDELGIEPTVELRRLERAVLRQEVEAAPNGAPARPLPTGRTVTAGSISRQRVLPERTPFVGRDAERGRLADLMERALAGEGGLVMIGGEPGVGKSRLVLEVAAAAPAPCRAMVGHCYEGQGDLPFMPWVEFLEQATREIAPDTLRRALGDDAPELARMYPPLRRLFPDIPAPLELPADQQRRYTFNSIRDYLSRVSRLRPQLLVLEDVHWADEGTLLFTQFVAEHLPTIPCLVVGTYRDPPIDVSPQLAEALSHLVRGRRALLMTLRRHSEPEVGAMLGALTGHLSPPGVTAAIHAETEGNAFFVEEVFRHLTETGRLLDEEGRFRGDLSMAELGVPENVRLVTGRRLDRLSEPARRMLTVAAVMGRRFSFDLLSAAGEIEEDALLDAVDEAQQARLIAGEHTPNGGLWFSHELIRQTMLTRLSPPRRQRLHLRIADALERLHGGDVSLHSADVASHLVQAGTAADTARTVRFLFIAGQQALAATAFEQALRHLEKAVSLAPAVDERERAELLLHLGTARRSAGQWDEAVSAWREALDVYQALGDAEAVGRICLMAGFSLTWAGRTEESVEMAQRGVAALGERVSADRARLLGHLGFTLGAAGQYEYGAELIEQEIALGATLDDDDAVVGHGLSVKALHRFMFMEQDDCAEAGLQAVRRLRAAGDLWQAATTLGFASIALVDVGRFDEAHKLRDELEPLADRLGHWPALMQARRVTLMLELCERPDIDTLEALATADLELCRSAGFPWFCHSITWLGLADFMRGDWDAAVAHAEEATRLEPPGALNGWDWGFLFQHRAYLGQHDEVMRMLEQRRADLPRPGQANGWGSWQMMLSVIEGLVVLGERDEAAALYPLVVECIARTRTICPNYNDCRLLERVAGMAAAAGGHWEKAVAHFTTALHQAEELPHRLEQPEVRRFFAVALLDRDAPGHRDHARRLLDEALTVYRSIGMPRHLAMTEQLLTRV